MSKDSMALFWGLNDPHKFLAKISTGRSTSDYAQNSVVFAQGADADTIFYLQEGRVKVTVTSDKGEESTSEFWKRVNFLGTVV